MRARLLATALVCSSVALAACSSDNTLGLGVVGGLTGTDTLNNARVRFANATATSFDVAVDNVVSAGNAALGFGSASSCISTPAATPRLAVRVAGTTTTVAGFAPSFQSGGRYAVIAYPGPGGATQFVALINSFTPFDGQAGLRAFNAAAAGTSFDVYVTTPGAPIASAVAAANAVTAGTGSIFANVAAGRTQQIRVTAAGSTTVLLDVGNVTLDAGQRTTLVIAPPAAGSTVLRAFVVTECA